MEFLKALPFVVAGFLLGGIMFGKLIPLILTGKDVTVRAEDHNPGAANAFIECGVKIGLLCVFLDIMKGFLPVIIACGFVNPHSFAFSFVIVAPVAGHALGVFNRFRGGKCISTCFGVMLGISPLTPIGIILAGLYIFFSVVYKVSPTRKRSMLVFALFGVSSLIILWVRDKIPLAVGCFFISLIAYFRHVNVSALIPERVDLTPISFGDGATDLSTDDGDDDDIKVTNEK